LIFIDSDTSTIPRYWAVSQAGFKFYPWTFPFLSIHHARQPRSGWLFRRFGQR